MGADFFSFMQYDDMPIDALMELVQQIVAFHMKVDSIVQSENLYPICSSVA